MIARPRLEAQLRETLARTSVAMLIAPAGYGKTSLVNAVLTGAPAVWYRARAWHRGEFLTPLVNEIRALRPDFGRMTLALAKRHPLEGSDEAPQLTGGRLGASFASELAHVRDELVVAIDDAQSLEDDPVFAAFLRAAADALPDHVRLIVIGRAMPRLPIAEWVATNRAAIIAAEELRFDDAEVRELAKHFHTSDAKDVSVETLRERFDGWAAGLALFFAAGEGALPARGDSIDAYSNYLIEVNIGGLKPKLAVFLEMTCAYERLDAAVLEADNAVADARSRLAELERSGVMVSIEKAGSTYRLHPLLREALRERVRVRDGAGAMREAHARAAATYERCGLLESALYHLERADDPAHATEFLTRHGHELFVAGIGERAARIARKFAERSPGARAVASLLDGMLLRQYGLPGAGERFEAGLAALRAAPEAPDDDRLESALRLVAVEDALARRKPLDAQTITWLDATAQRADRPREAAEAAMYSGWLDAVAGDFERAGERSRRALAYAGSALVPRVRVSALAAYVATCEGRFDDADRELTSVLGELEESDALVLLANTLVWHARLALLWGDVATARDYTEQGHALAKRLDLAAELAGVALARTAIASYDGDLAALREACADARRYGSAAWYAADRDRSLANATLLDARATFVREGPQHALERLGRLGASPPEVQKFCAALDEAAYRAASDRRTQPAKIKQLAASDALLAHDALDAVEIARALAIASALGIELPPEIETRNEARFGGLLRERRERERDEPAYRDATLVKLLARKQNTSQSATVAIVTAAESSAPEGVAPGSLTKREREILELLALGLTNKEMAQRLTVSPRTIDTHVERVLSKLGVPSRTRAVAAALRYGLVAGS